MAEKKATKKKEPFEKMTKEEKIDWDELFEYVKLKVLNYDKTMTLTPNMIYKLRELKTGRIMSSRHVKSNFEYTFKSILITFKFCSIEIERAIRTKEFASEDKKFAYIMAIVKNNINDVVLRLENVKKQKEKIENRDMSYLDNDVKAEYKSKKKKVNKRLEGMW